MTIYALSTGPGVSGIAIIRISGSETKKILVSLTGKDLPTPRMASLRKINNINTSELIDEGIIIWFPGPQSYTGEDMAEIHVHGGKAVVLAVQNEISKIKNCRLAEPGELHSPYAFFKSTVAKLIEGYSDWYGLRFNICYFYNVFGPGTNLWANEWQSVINIFKDQKEKEVPLTITGDGTQKRDFTHVNDIIQGLILAGDDIRNEQFQLGTGKEYSILEIAAAFDHPVTFIPPRPGDRKNGLADIGHTSETLGYKPTVDVIDYIKNI